METSALTNFYSEHDEQLNSCFLALRDIITGFDENITTHWKWKLPFFYLNNKPFCYLWKDKKTSQPYIGIVKGNEINHPLLEQGSRVKMKILKIRSDTDIPIKDVLEVLTMASKQYF